MSEGRSLEVRSLKVLSFNVEGLDSMLLDPNFMELAMKHDICLLSETMRKEDSKLNGQHKRYEDMGGCEVGLTNINIVYLSR